MRHTKTLLGFTILSGALLRLYFLFASQWLIEGDEAAVGLQALHILRGERPIFYPGQAYLGNVESYLVAAIFAVLGASQHTLKLVPFVFALIFIFLSFQIGKELFHAEHVGLLAALIAALAPVYFVMWSLKARGGFIEALVLAQLALLWFTRWLPPPDHSPPSPALLSPVTKEQEKGEGVGRSVVRSSPPRWFNGLIFGLVSGYAIWMNPLVVYVLAPIVVILFFHALTHLRRWRTAIVPALSATLGAFIGLLPLILFGLTSNADAFLRATHHVPPQNSWADLVQQLAEYFWRDGLLTMLGLRDPKDKLFALDWRVMVIPIYALALVWLIGQMRKSRGAAVLLLMMLFSFPIFAFGSITGENFAAIIPDSGLLTRYLLPLYIPFTLALGLLLARLPKLLRRIALTLLIAVNLWSVFSADAVALSRNEFANQPLPADHSELITFLEQSNLSFIYTNHWIGYPLMLESRERIVTYDFAASDLDRFPAYSQAVRQARNPALVIYNPHYEPNPIDARLRQLQVSFDKQALQHFIIYYNFNPPLRISSLADALQWPYY